MVTSNGSRGKGRLTQVAPQWVVTWANGSEQWFTNLGDAFYALHNNGEKSMELAEAHAIIALGRKEAARPDAMRRNPITGHFTGGDRS